MLFDVVQNAVLDRLGLLVMDLTYQQRRAKQQVQKGKGVQNEQKSGWSRDFFSLKRG